MSRIERLRLLMGDEAFAEGSRKGAQRKAEADQQALLDAEAKRQAETERIAETARLEAMALEEASAARRTGITSDYEGPDVKVEYASMAEIRAMIRAQRNDNLEIGELSPPGMEFCPILAVAKFPYKYMDAKSPESDKVSKRFFANERFWQRQWSLYYIHPPVSVSVKPLILVPAKEVIEFLALIKSTMAIDICLDGSAYQRGLKVSFDDDGHPRPRYLGNSNSKNLFTALENSIPNIQDDMPEPAGRTFEVWKRKIDAAFEATQKKNKRSKQKKQQQRVATKSDWARQLRRLQRYLGLRQTNIGERKNAYLDAKTTEEQDAVALARAFGQDDPVDPLNVDDAPQCQFDGSIVFVCIDVESYELSHGQITEIGIAILDTEALHRVAPKANAVGWRPLVKGRHFIIKEYSHLVNSKFVNGCPDRYEPEFGVSERISITDAKATIQACFSEYTSADPVRTVVLVGHNIDSDLDYLRKLELNLTAIPGVLETLDTATLYQSWKRLQNPPSLANVLCELEISGWNLHNAGNDAGYTLQALAGIAVQSMQHVAAGSDLDARIQRAKVEAEEKVKEAAREWDIAEKSAEDEQDSELEVD